MDDHSEDHDTADRFRGTIFEDGAVAKLGEALKIIRRSQHLIETDGPWATKQPTRDNVRQYSFALVDEVTEYAKELGWKDWKQVPQHNGIRIADEFADIIAFMGVIMDYGLKLGMLHEYDLAKAYQTKTGINLERVAGKVAEYGSLELQREGRIND